VRFCRNCFQQYQQNKIEFDEWKVELPEHWTRKEPPQECQADKT
jgi:hypothetical protein